jgi:hypothetical protein
MLVLSILNVMSETAIKLIIGVAHSGFLLSIIRLIEVMWTLLNPVFRAVFP